MREFLCLEWACGGIGIRVRLRSVFRKEWEFESPHAHSMQKPAHKQYAIAGIAAASLYFLYCLATPAAWHFIDGVNLIFHEAGHTIFGILGIEFLAVAGGTLMQLLIPFGVAAYFWKSRQHISAMIAAMWGGQSLVNVYVYAADAQRMELELLGGGDAIHDWNYMLIHSGLFMHTNAVATFIHILAVICTAGAIAGALYLLFSAEWNSKGLR